MLLGNLALMTDQKVYLNGLQSEAQRLQGEAKTAMWLAVDGQASGVIAVADTIKDGSVEAVARLKETGRDGGHDDGRQPGDCRSDCARSRY